MRKESIQLGPLNQALASLEKAMAQPKDEFTRDSVIQRFEYTLELAWKTMKRCLEASGLPDPISPKGTVREAARAGWILDPELWIRFIEDRNLTSHTYQESIAEKVYSTALLLPAEVKKILPWLTKI